MSVVYVMLHDRIAEWGAENTLLCLQISEVSYQLRSNSTTRGSPDGE